MTQDSRTQRTAAANGTWSPFDVDGTPSTDGAVDADVRPSTVRADASGWRPVVIEGGRGQAHPDEDTTVDGSSVDVLDAAAADALAILDAPPNPAEPDPSPVEPAPVVEPEPAQATSTPAPETVTETPKGPVAPAQEADSTPHTPHPAQTHSETPAPAHSPAQAAETPHSTPWLRTAVGWLNPYDILDQPLPPVSAIYEAASTTVTNRNGFDRITEIGWVYAIGMPITVACYTLAAAVQHKARGIGVGLTVLAWVLAADAAPVDASVIWWWTAVGYWVSTALILPAVIQAKK